MSINQNTANFPGPNAPIDQDGEVILSQPWFQFFLSILSRTGGNGTPPGDTASLVVALKAVQAQADFQSVVLQDPSVQEALRRIAELAAEMMPAPDLRQFGVRSDEMEARFMDAQMQDWRAVMNRIDEIDSRLLDQPVAASAPLEQWNAPTLTNSWVNYGGSFNPAGYWRDPFSLVHLRGTMKSGTIGSAAFTLPAGYRPANTELHAVTSNSAFARIVIDGGGVVTPDIGSNVNVSIDGVTFRAAT